MSFLRKTGSSGPLAPAALCRQKCLAGGAQRLRMRRNGKARGIAAHEIQGRRIVVAQHLSFVATCKL